MVCNASVHMPPIVLQRSNLATERFHVSSVSHDAPLFHTDTIVVVEVLIPSSTVCSFFKETRYLGTGQYLGSSAGSLYANPGQDGEVTYLASARPFGLLLVSKRQLFPQSCNLM